jgi:DNA-binding transcriptional LysR family regulator
VAVQFSLAKSILMEWTRIIREQIPRLDLYLETNFSQQIQRDVLTGDTDIGTVFAPQQFPDLHVSEIGAETFVMMSTEAAHFTDVDWASYVMVAYTSYFERQHDQLFPDLVHKPTVVGSDDLAVEFLRENGGTAFLPALSAPVLTEAVPGLKPVSEAPDIPQPLYSIVHARRRHDTLVREAVTLFQRLVQEHSIGRAD